MRCPLHAEGKSMKGQNEWLKVFSTFTTFSLTSVVIGAEFINLDTHDPKVLTPGGTTKIGLSKVSKVFENWL